MKEVWCATLPEIGDRVRYIRRGEVMESGIVVKKLPAGAVTGTPCLVVKMDASGLELAWAWIAGSQRRRWVDDARVDAAKE